jgi:surface polysaccharide O-acyltransferase-like enzyme
VPKHMAKSHNYFESIAMSLDSKREHLVYFDYFRAISIILIVMGHSYGSWERDSVIEMSFSNLISGGTALFVFISGFFFRNVFNENYSYKAFVLKKCRSVLLPYLFMSISAMSLYYYLMLGFIPFPIQIGTGQAAENSFAFIMNLGTGRTLTAYWYIPFIMLVFVASPLFRKIMEFSNRQILVLLILTFALSIYIQRPALNLNPIHSFIYFFPFYLFGIYYSKQRQFLDEFLKNNTLVLFFLLISAVVFMTLLGQLGNLHKDFLWEWNGIDYMVLQKFLLILFLLSLTMKIQSRHIASMKYIADISFAIFFIHPWVLLAVNELGIFQPYSSGAAFIFKFILVMASSVLITFSFKLALGSKSRYLVGY